MLAAVLEIPEPGALPTFIFLSRLPSQYRLSLQSLVTASAKSSLEIRKTTPLVPPRLGAKITRSVTDTAMALR